MIAPTHCECGTEYPNEHTWECDDCREVERRAMHD